MTTNQAIFKDIQTPAPDSPTIMATPAKTTYHHGDLRQSLIDAAIALINEEGISDLSLRQVARRVGVSHNAPYRHFEDKEALLAAVAEQGFSSLQVAMETNIEGIPLNNYQERLTAIGIAYVKFALTHPTYYRLMFGEYRCNREKYPSLVETSQGSFMVLVDTITAGQKAGDFRVGDPVNMARVAWSLVHGQAMLALDDKLQVNQGEELEAFLQFSAQMLIQGLAGN